MAEIVNLRQGRKRKKRAAKAAQAAENRLAFGRAKAEKRLSKAERDKAALALEGKRLDHADED